jgi:hypothetical protein
MSPFEAQRKLSARLVFGNPDQIEAVRVLEAVAEAVAALKACTCVPEVCGRCGGDGDVWGPEGPRECGACNGAGVTGSCECVERWPRSVVVEAVARVAQARLFRCSSGRQVARPEKHNKRP